MYIYIFVDFKELISNQLIKLIVLVKVKYEIINR